MLGQEQKFETEQGTEAGLNDKVYLLYKAAPSSMGEVVISFTVQKPAQRLKQNVKKQGVCSRGKDKIKPQ